MSELIERTLEQEAALERAMAGMDAQADIWAEEVNLVGMIKNVAQVARLKPHVPDDVREGFIGRMEAQIDAIARQCFLEGWVRGGMSRQDYDAAEISRLQEALAAAETERDGAKRLLEIQIAGHRLSAKDATANLIRANAAEAKLASLPALLAETRKKALEEAAQVADAMRAKHGSPVGPAYDNGVWDQGVRIATAIRSLLDTTPESEARKECGRRGIDPDEICADGGVEAWMVVAQELAQSAAIRALAGEVKE